MHENLSKHIECEIGQDSWTKATEIDFNKRGYALKFVDIQFDAGAAGDVDLKIENERGRLIPFTTGNSDDFVRAISDQPISFYVGVGLGKGDTFELYYRNRASDNKHYINVFMEFVSRGNND